MSKKNKKTAATNTQTRCDTHTHTSAPSNNPLILFIISQLFLVQAIHERNHTHKHTPMCRAEIQYKYTHLYFLISASIFTPAPLFFPPRSVMHRLCSDTSQSHINARPLGERSSLRRFLRLKSFAKLQRSSRSSLPSKFRRILVGRCV